MFIGEITEASSSNLRLNKIMKSLKEILHEEKMISEDEIKDIQKEYNTHNQKLSTLEACTCGMMYLCVGDTIDLREIAKEIN